MKLPVIGDRVYVDTFLFSGYAEVTYIDNPNLYNHYLSPIQVTLEQPDSEGHTVKRVSLLEIKID